jgi:two-component system sensor histidine kinase BarA
MSTYRALKHLVGETSLERKFRYLFGAFVLVLITCSFWLYAHITEDLAYNQLPNTSRLLVNQIMDRQLATGCHSPNGNADAVSRGNDEPRKVPSAVAAAAGVQATTAVKTEEEQRKTAIDEFRKKWEERWPEPIRNYQYWTITPNASRPENTAYDNYTQELLKEFQKDESKNEENQLLPAEHVNYYYGAVRASKNCLGCHRNAGNPDLKENDLLALIKIKVSTDSIEKGVIMNRAILISTAFVTAVLIMIACYAIVRYVIVKPVKHLKEVSDAISAGELNVRSEIQTGDEFEDLSHAFNRMLRNLVSMQDRLRKVNTDLDRKVDELAQANLALFESNRLKGDFLATISHELRTPLNSILGFSEVLLTTPALTEKQTRWLTNIQTSGTHLLNLINDILDLAKIEAGKMQVRLVEFSSYDVCEGLLTMFRPLAEKKNIDLRGTFAPGIPLLQQDVVKFQQMLSNLLSNAIKFTPEGGRVLLKAETDLAQIILTVNDTGVGIAAEEQALVFEKFRQAGNPMTREHAGTGLGLSIVRELAKLLGGGVTLQSELGRGSTFTVRLPLQLSEEPRLEFDLAHEGIDLSKAQRVDVRLYGEAAVPKPQPEPTT